MFRSRAVQATAEGGLFTLGILLVTVGSDMVSRGEGLVGAISIVVGGVLLIANRFVHLPA